MKYIERLGLKISEICLGTAQLGLNYGIANNNGKPTVAEAECILNEAFSKGINLLDTAGEYGESEAIIGKILGKSPKKSKIMLATKLGGLAEFNCKKDLQRKIEEKLYKSLENLQVNNITFYLLHDPEYLDYYDGYILEYLVKKRDEGLISHLGASVYTLDEAEKALEQKEINVIQVPFNIFDQRLLDIDFFERAKKMDKLIMVRSIFLQGLLFLGTIGDLPNKFFIYRKYFNELERLLASNGMNLVEAALGFALQKSRGTVIMGVDSLEQLRKNFQNYKKSKHKTKELQLLEKAFSHMPLELIDPRLW